MKDKAQPKLFKLHVEDIEYVVDLEKHAVRRGREDIHLEPQSFHLLEKLLRHGKVTRKELIDEMGGPDSLNVGPRVNEAIRKLRAAFGDTGDVKHFVARTRDGYKLVARVVAIQGGEEDTQALLTVVPPQTVGTNKREKEFCERMVRELTRELGRIAPPELAVVVWSSSGGKDTNRAARKLGANCVVTSSTRTKAVSRSIVLDWEVMRLANSRLVCSDQEEFDQDEEDEVVGRLAQKIVEGMGMKPKPPRVFRLQSNPIAREAYGQGRSHWEKRTREDLEIACGYFNNAIKAVETERFFARSYAGVAESCALLALAGSESAKRTKLVERAKKAAAKSLRLNPELPEGLTVDAEIKFRFDWDWVGARIAFEQAIKFNRNYPTAHHWFSLYLTAMGDDPRAQEEAKYAQSLNPGSCIINADAAWSFYNCGEYRIALENCEKALKIDSEFWVAHWVKGLVFEEHGKYPEAVRELERAKRPWPEDPRFMARTARVYALSGEQSKAWGILKELREMQKKTYVPPYFLATVYEALEQRQEVIGCLEEAFKEQSPTLVFLRADPSFKKLSKWSEFQRLLSMLPFPT
jgi:tetratricopeptide (TPR) repeat protein/DNA-binding winged helix-turn-helix (wHTH) protein